MPTVATVSESADRSPQSPTPNPQSPPYRIPVLASGRGSNLQALMDAIAGGTLAAEIVGVFSDRSKAVALQPARDAAIAPRSLAPQGFPRPAGLDRTRVFLDKMVSVTFELRCLSVIKKN